MAIVVSGKPKKQRKKFYSKKLHELQKNISVHLSKELQKSIGKRALGARKEDKAKILRGKFEGKIGKIVSVNRRKNRIFIDGITRKKVSGKEVFVPLQPSNLELTELYSKDKLRLKRTKAKDAKQPEKTGKEKETKGTEKPKEGKKMENEKITKKGKPEVK